MTVIVTDTGFAPAIETGFVPLAAAAWRTRFSPPDSTNHLFPITLLIFTVRTEAPNLQTVYTDLISARSVSLSSSDTLATSRLFQSSTAVG